MKRISCVPSIVRWLEYTADSALICSGLGDADFLKRVVYWDHANGEARHVYEAMPLASGYAVSRHGSAFAYAGPSHGKVHYRDKSDVRILYVFERATLALDDTGRAVAIGYYGRRNQIRVDRPDDRPGESQYLHTILHLRRMAFSPCGRFLACSGRDGLTLWDLTKGESIGVDNKKDGGAISFARDGSLLATVFGSQVVLRTGPDARPLRTLEPVAGERPRALAFSLDSRVLATACANLIQLWDVQTGRRVASYDWGIGKIHSVALSPDGLTAAAGGSSGRIVIWDLEG